ncbi:MAG TPA: DedA family protein [Solirubrobacteraceae bacterium]|jgi:membrane protein DedA with SNARE-associated domain
MAATLGDLVLLAYASLTEPLVKLATNLIGDLGLAGVALLTFTSGVIGIPGTEPTMLFAGFNVFQGHQTLVGIIVAGVIGDVAGASVAYGIGYYGRRELLERQGSKLHVNPASLNRAHRWFDRYGSPVVVVSRLLPFIRAAFPYAAGVAEMPFWRFLPLAALGSAIWIGGLGILGREVGSQWQAWRHHLEYVDYVGAVVVVAAIVYLIVRWRSSRNDSGGEPAADVVSD